MKIPRTLLQKFLDGEISPDHYRQELKKEVLGRFIIMSIINLIALSIFLPYLANLDGIKSNLGLRLLGIFGLYLAIAGIFQYVFYREERKNINFLTDIHLENARKNPDTFPKNIPWKTPGAVGKMYLRDEVSKLEYIKAVMNFRLNALRICFVLFLILTLVMFAVVGLRGWMWLATSYLLAFFMAWMVRMRAFGILLFAVNQTLQKKRNL